MDKKIIAFTLLTFSFLCVNIVSVRAMEHMAGLDQRLIQNLEIIEPEIEVVIESETTIETEPEIIEVFTVEEKELLARLAMAEAEGETMAGKVAVLNVVINRSNIRNQTIKQVIYAPSQFCTSGRFNLIPNADCWEAVERVANGEKQIPDNVEYFCAARLNFSYLEFVCQIGNHKFFRE